MNYYRVQSVPLWLILVVSLWACQPKQPPPTWIAKGNHSLYPEDLYLQGMGAASLENGEVEAKNKADVDATNQILAQIRVSIESESESTIKSILRLGSSGTSEESVQHFKENIKTKTRIDDLEGVSIVGRFKDDERDIYYSLAILEREKGSFSLQKTIERLRAEIAAAVDSADAALGTAHIYQAFINLFPLKEKFDDLVLKESLYRVIAAKNPPPWDKTLSVALIQTKISGILQNLKLTKAGGDKQKAEIGTKLSEPLQVRLVFHSGKTTLPVEGMPIQFSILEGKADLNEAGVTDENGRTNSIVFNTFATGTKFNRVKAGLDLSAFTGPSFTLVPVDTEFVFTLPTRADLKIAVLTSEKNHEQTIKDKIVEPAISAVLSSAGYNIVENDFLMLKTTAEETTPEQLKKLYSRHCDYLVLGNAVSKPFNDPNAVIGGIALDINFSYAEGYLRIIDLKRGTLLKGLDIKQVRNQGGKNQEDSIDTKDGALTKEESGFKALQKLSDHATRRILKVLDQAFSGSS